MYRDCKHISCCINLYRTILVSHNNLNPTHFKATMMPRVRNVPLSTPQIVELLCFVIWCPCPTVNETALRRCHDAVGKWGCPSETCQHIHGRLVLLKLHTRSTYSFHIENMLFVCLG